MHRGVLLSSSMSGYICQAELVSASHILKEKKILKQVQDDFQIVQNDGEFSGYKKFVMRLFHLYYHQ
ncbi:hypothetical protein [Ignavibacterium sp.]|uniref:hypothetical protein n=1 Tax=Ignavibacterium sp. TaxID=2651167 RepID=UPI00307D5E8E